MMWILIASTVTLVTATVAAQLYLRDAARDYRRARKMWDIVHSSANKILEGGYPPEVREMVMGLSMTTGCGCYVRSLLFEHYTPNLHRSRIEASKKRRSSDVVNQAIRALTPQQKRLIDHFVGSVIAFDMMYNPLQGWLLRHVMAKRFAIPAPVPAVPSPSRAEREAVIRTVVRKKPELCAA